MLCVLYTDGVLLKSDCVHGQYVRACACLSNIYFFIWIYKGFVPTLQELIYIPILQLTVSLLYVISLIGSVRSVTYLSGFFVKKNGWTYISEDIFSHLEF
jgi:hypothetical protein